MTVTDKESDQGSWKTSIERMQRTLVKLLKNGSTRSWNLCQHCPVKLESHAREELAFCEEARSRQHAQTAGGTIMYTLQHANCVQANLYALSQSGHKQYWTNIKYKRVDALLGGKDQRHNFA